MPFYHLPSKLISLYIIHMPTLYPSLVYKLKCKLKKNWGNSVNRQRRRIWNKFNFVSLYIYYKPFFFKFKSKTIQRSWSWVFKDQGYFTSLSCPHVPKYSLSCKWFKKDFCDDDVAFVHLLRWSSSISTRYNVRYAEIRIPVFPVYMAWSWYSDHV